MHEIDKFFSGSELLGQKFDILIRDNLLVGRTHHLVERDDEIFNVESPFVKIDSDHFCKEDVANGIRLALEPETASVDDAEIDDFYALVNEAFGHFDADGAYVAVGNNLNFFVICCKNGFRKLFSESRADFLGFQLAEFIKVVQSEEKNFTKVLLNELFYKNVEFICVPENGRQQNAKTIVVGLSIMNGLEHFALFRIFILWLFS